MSYKHALFLYPYIESSSTSFMGLFPPTGLEYVATNAKEVVDRLTILDLRYEKELCNIDKLRGFIRSEGIDVMCVGISWNRQFEEICGILNLLPDNLPLIIGGYKATEQVEEIFKKCPGVDIIVRGEGEDTIKELLSQRPLEKILGISFRKGKNVIHNANRPLPDVNKITYPDRSLRRYKYQMSLGGINVMPLTFDTILGSRGCPFNCKFCTFSLNPLGQKRSFSPRNVDSIIEEIEEIDSDIILFSDDNFGTVPKRAEKICDSIIKKRIKKRFIAQARIDIARHPTLLEKMTRAGFKMLLIGVESPHDWILKQFDKGFDSATVRKCFAVLRKYPIYYHGYFIYGNIGENEKEMLYISDFAKEIGVDSITFHKLRIEKFSPLKEIAEQTPGYHVTERGEIYSDMYSHATLKKIGKKIKFAFYRPTRLLRIGLKFIRVRFLTVREMLAFALVSPLLLVNVVKREIERGRLGDSLRRIFINNK